MKNIILLITLILIFGVYSCENEQWEFSDYEYTTAYFPYQFPLRTLILGDYAYDNTNDNNLKFLVSARVAGMYENTSDWTLTFETAEDLTDNLVSANGNEIKVLPPNYYTLNPANELVISRGEFHAGIEVQLADAFLNDSLSIGFNYVIPLRITSSTTDSILVGLPANQNADPRKVGDWIEPPKNFTLFGIKYVNEFHGNYLHRGISVIRNAAGEEVETIVYRNKYVEEDEVWFLKTTGRNRVFVQGELRSTSSNGGNFNMELVFDDNLECSITHAANSDYPVTGSGMFVKDGGEWGNKKRNAIHLAYEIDDGTYTHYITDTLVFRDKAITFDEFEPIVKDDI